MLEFLLIKLQAERLATLLKETSTQVFSREYYGIFKNSFFTEHLCWLLLNFFTGFQKETVFSINHLIMKTFKCSSPCSSPTLCSSKCSDFTFNMSIRCSDRTTQSETIFFIVDFFFCYNIYRYFLFVCL